MLNYQRVFIYMYNNQFNLETTFSYILLLWTSKPNPLGPPPTTYRGTRDIR